MSFLPELNRCSLLHKGGEASIYKAYADNKPYVLKWYREGVGFDESALETISQKRLDGVFKVRESGLHEGHSYVVYDFIEGVDSGCVAPMNLAVALHSMRQLVSALKELQKCGIHHGDLSPSNVMVTADGPVLIDCGIKGPGALAYAAPERMKGAPASEKSDLFSLGLLLYFWLTGEDLLKAESFDDFLKAASSVEEQDVTMLLFGKFGLTASLEGIWKGTLCSDPENRLEDLDEFDELLEIAFDGVCGGSVTWAKTQECFVEALKAKIGTDCLADGAECDFPYHFAGAAQKKATPKSLIAVVLGLILLIVILLAILLPKGSSIDETGDRMLKESRSLESVVGDTSVTGDSAEFGL